MSVYYLFTCYRSIDLEKDAFISRISIALLAYIVPLVCVTFFMDIGRVSDTLGLLSAAASIMMFASPLSNIREVIRTSDARSISWLTTLVALCNTLAWYFYGTLVGDVFVSRVRMHIYFYL